MLNAAVSIQAYNLFFETSSRYTVSCHFIMGVMKRRGTVQLRWVQSYSIDEQWV